MFRSRCTTINVPTISTISAAGTNEPRPIIHSAGHDLLVRIRNNSLGAYVLIAYEPAALMSFPNWADVYKLPAGSSDTFVVANGEQLYCASPGVGAEISMAVSEAIPVDPSVDGSIG